LDVSRLTTHHFPFDHALKAYNLIQEGTEPYVGIVLQYDVDRRQDPVIEVTSASRPHRAPDRVGVGFVGAGNYASVHLLPHVERHDSADCIGLVTATGLNAQQKAEKFDFQYCTTDLQPLLEDDAVTSIFIATRHSTHAEFTSRALRAGKHVFVEKPLAVTPAQLAEIEDAYREAQEHGPTGLMVGLNRRFAPMVQAMREALPPGAPKQLVYRVNSGPIGTDTWLHHPEEGGGMLVSEMCHFIDLMQYLAAERPVGVFAQALTLGREDRADHDNVAITVSFDGGSVGTLNYNTIGDGAAPKERLEVFGSGTAARLDDFRRLYITKNGATSTTRHWNQDKGQEAQVNETIEGFRTRGRGPVPYEELVLGMRAVFAAQESLRTGGPVDISGL
jgi:polar amino acid transport system substrate-binding protein